MDKKIQIGIIAIVILTLLAGYFFLTPHYKEIEMSGFTFEVPESNAEVKNNSINYNTYLDTENDLNIKTWACKDLNDVNGTANATVEMGTQLGENMGTNITYNNLTLYNKSGTYTYYEPDVNNSCIILITSKNINAIEHIIETMRKPHIIVNSDQFNMTTNGLILTAANNETSSNDQTTTTNKKSSSKNKKRSSSSSDTIDGEKVTGVVPSADPDYERVSTENNFYYRNKKTGETHKRVLGDDGVYYYT